MEYIYATLTLNELDQELNQENITAVLEAAGADVVESRVKAIVAALEDVDLEHLAFESELMQATTGGQALQTAEVRDDIGFTDLDETPADADDETEDDPEAIEIAAEEDDPIAEIFDLDESDDDEEAADLEDELTPDAAEEEASPDDEEER